MDKIFQYLIYIRVIVNGLIAKLLAALPTIFFLHYLDMVNYIINH